MFIVLILFMQSCGGKSNGGSTNPSAGKETSSSEISYNSKEKVLAEKLSLCFEDFEANLKELGNLENDDAQFVAIGVTGNECLDIKSLGALKFIQIEYKNAKNNSHKNWKQVARKMIKKDLI
jgi:hypothetical protein